MAIRNTLGKFVKKVFPRKIYKLIANGAIIVPAYYKTIIEDAEKNFDLSLKDSDERALLLMRKYAHILDKGLHRKDAQPGHSREIYTLLSESIKRLSKTKYAGDSTVEWAQEKLRVYESLQNNDNFEPLHGEKPTIDVSIEQFESLVKARRSNRDFTNRVVANQDIKRLKNIANWASSSCNKQPIEIYATNNPELAAKCLKCCKGGTGFGKYIPSFWVFTADILGYVWPSEIYLPVVDTCLGVQNVMLGATTLGLSATILSWAQKCEEEEKELKKLLNIPINHQIIVCAVMGYSNSEFMTPARKTV